MNRSQRILVVIGLSIVLAMAAPYLLRGLVDSRATSGKALIFEGRSPHPQKDLVLCLIKRPGALNLTVASNDLYTDAASGLAIRVENRGETRQVRAWLPQGQTLGAEPMAQLKGCVGE